MNKALGKILKTDLTTKTGFIKEDSSLGDVIAYISTSDQDNGQNSMTNINIFDEGFFMHKYIYYLCLSIS